MIVDDDGDEIGANKASSQIERNMKAMAMLVVVILVIAAYISQLYKLQIKNGDYYRGKSQRVSSHTDTIPAQRGEIFDRNATLPMVVNSDSFVVSLNPAEIPRGYYDTVTSRLSSILGIAKLEIDRKIPEKSRKIYKSIDIKMNVPFSVISNIAENIIDLPGVSWQLKPIRRYVETGSISHVVGYVGDITKEEINMMYNQGYTENMVVGKMGIEKQYDSLLQGTPGSVRKNVDARGRAISNELITTQPQMGKSLVLTIDSRIQELAEKALGNRVGAAVVLKPASGEILAMVSYPYYDQNIFSNDDAAAQYNKLVKSPNNPLLNRVVNAVYPPASTFKTIMTTAALSERVIPPSKKIECSGKVIYGDRTFRCHQRWGHGMLDMRGALAESCDIYYWVLGRDYLGVDRIASYAKEFGLGQSLEIDLPSQAAGFVPTAQWKERKYHVKWLGGDTMNMSIGQGYTLVTPLHIANMMAMVANGGKIYRPHLLKEVRDPATNEVIETVEPSLLHESNIEPSVWRAVQSDLRYVISDGTPQWPMENKVVKVAGKTGTAEVGFVDHWHAWMATFGPYDAAPEDQVVVVVLVEAVNDWDWWSPYATNIIYQGIFANQTYEQAVQALPNVRYYMGELARKVKTNGRRQE
ncbi:MAG: penicillin-binding protein 2 [Treponema sp.]|uniref:penicillin-binding protein 2 n=1 Tax=Treponema sp. TaxID=166 RepID=UPI00257E2E8B|nr:penicillin-binding protein 2 [Treponema sp.]MBQ5537299.1 penicillin-binding protein 2 [Treponema sp.]